MFCHNGEAGKLNAVYRIAYNWSKTSGVQNMIETEILGGALPNKLEPVMFVRQFLALRPLSQDLERWIEYWSTWGRMVGDFRVSLGQDVTTPPITAADVPHVAADLFDWDRAEIKRFGKFECHSVPYLPGHHKAGELGDLRKNGFRLAYHGTNAYALYAQVYHGKLPVSGGSANGDRALKDHPGVYLFDEQVAAKSVFSYVHKAQIGWEGLLHGFAWEVVYKDCRTSSGSAAGNQTACKQDVVILYNLFMFSKPAEELVTHDDWVYCSMDGSPWNPRSEANPFDPTASWNNKTGCSHC